MCAVSSRFVEDHTKEKRRNRKYKNTAAAVLWLTILAFSLNPLSNYRKEIP